MRHIHSSRLHAAGLQMAGEAGTGVLPGPGQPGFVPAPVGRRASKAPGENSPVSREKLRQSGILALQRVLIYGSALAVPGFLAGLIIYVVISALPALDLSLFSPVYTPDNVSLLPALINTGAMILLALLFALPPGVIGAIYLTEYTRPGSPVAAAIGLGAEVLTSVPSIVFGLFGSLFLVRFMNLGMSLLAGSLTMALIILPGILRTSQQALSEVPDDLRQASLGLGAGKLRTILRVVLPSALPGILSGTILATGRITGESAALIFTAGTAVNLVPGLDQSARTLAVHMYTLAGEGLHIPQAWATALILLILVLVLNLAAAGARRAMERKMRG